MWLGGARVEAAIGNFVVARQLLVKAFSDAPAKTRATVRIEQARCEEYAGEIDAARRMLHMAKKESKVFTHTNNS